MAVVSGDVQTSNDADRLARYTDRLVQAVVTGGACHLDARQVTEALEAVDLDATDLLFIENVGNLVCPASWDLGEGAKVVIFSVTEGEDKPVKYPKMFRAGPLRGHQQDGPAPLRAVRAWARPWRSPTR